MSKKFINIKNNNYRHRENKRTFDDEHPLLEIKFQMQSGENQRKKKRNSRRIQLKAFLDIPFQQGYETSLQTTTGTIQMEKILTRTSK